uniref:Mitochondrial carrier protein n=1 Tax=Megaselia scalaris TaxID=36166 RepID=T1GQS1_MEGSC
SGLPPTVLRDVPFSGIYWSCYESIKGYFNVTTPTFQFSFLAGATAGMVAAFVTTPFDVIKTHRQIEFGTPVKDLPKRKTMDSLARLYSSNGLPGIFAGLGPRLAKVAPACAIMISSFEYGKSFFYRYNEKAYYEKQVTK